MNSPTFDSDDWRWLLEELAKKKDKCLEQLTDRNKSYKDLLGIQGKVEAYKDILLMQQRVETAALPTRGNK